MKEFKNIVAEYERVKDMQKLALATVVKVRGSSYRSPGARMLIRNDGRWTGSISGGCLEGDALRKARNVMNSGEPQLVTYDTMDDANNSLGVGLGCNGIIDVLIEPITESNNPIDKLSTFISYNNLTVMATVFRADDQFVTVGAQSWFDENGDYHSKINNKELSELIEKEMQSVYHNRKPAVKTLLNNSVEVFFEIIEPSIDLIIFGGGFDAKPVTEMASTLGWDVTVTDECIAHVAPAAFPKANVSFCKRENFSKDIPIKPYSAAVLMSHTFDYDYDALKMLLATDVCYIGILGPKKRAIKLYKQLEEEGVKLSKEDKLRIHSPIGLDIGAETPEEIALSIIAEIQAKFTNRSGGFLKYRTAPIHQRDGKEDQVFKQVFINSTDNKEAFL
ncbi:XdhC/CoxI family protein [Fulvivirga sp. RKSG066]|uniref:XdhC family protein n=1 Tax=Fulvivirga aurantia TaxID=2529383 RepID=UPI0012BD252F|nr:XdhC family protein [Fulvivirga aurantia]MTI21300.1 XdhC/CoxI family protein [Fulvivirga aurantia]